MTDPFASREGTRALLEKRIAPDMGKLMDGYRLVFLGEDRNSLCGKQALLEHMEEFVSAGFNFLALDAFPSEAQQAIDNYLFRGKGRSDVVGFIAKFPPEHRRLLEEVLDEARRINFEKKKKLSVIALEITEYLRSRYSWEFGSQVGRTREKKEEHMAAVLSHLLKKEKGSKIIVLVPSVYAQTNHAPRRVGISAGLRPLCIRVVDGSKSAAVNKTFYRRALEREIAAMGIQKDRFTIPLDSRPEGPFFHFILHYPEDGRGDAGRSVLRALKDALEGFLQKLRMRAGSFKHEECF